MSDDVEPEVDLPPVAQVSYMVVDMDEALPRFERLFGPFTVFEADNEGSIYKFLTKPWDDKQIREHVQKAFQHHQTLQG